MSEPQDRGLAEASGGQPERYHAAEVNAEAGDYIDDPAVWIALQDVVRRYGPIYAPLAERFGDAAADIMAGTIASYLADQHGVYLVLGLGSRLTGVLRSDVATRIIVRRVGWSAYDDIVAAAAKEQE